MSLQSKDSRVVSQGACDAPRCHSRDAKTLYDDGHSYCFSCHTYFKSEHKMGTVVPFKQQRTNPYPTRVPVDTAKDNYNWLKKYFLSDEEIRKYFFYAPISQRHVFAHGEGTEDEYYEARTVVGHIRPKTLSYGDKPTIFLGEPDATLVVVEDIVSAIRVGRQYGSLPLFGSFLSVGQMGAIKRAGYQKCVIWLDCDKYNFGMEYAKQMGMLMPTVAIQTLLDPKCLPDMAITHTIETALDTWENV